MSVLRSACGLSTAVLAATVLSACTAPDTTGAKLTGDSKAIDQTIVNLAADAQSRNNGHVCDNELARSVVDRLDVGSQTCTGVISKQLGEADDYAVTLASGNAITVTGNTATARVKDTYLGHKSHIDVLQMVREGRSWKIAGISPGA